MRPTGNCHICQKIIDDPDPEVADITQSSGPGMVCRVPEGIPLAFVAFSTWLATASDVCTVPCTTVFESD